MPDREFPKLRPHPARSSTPCTPRRRSDQYAELIATSNFTFLHGGSHPEELVERASELGYHAVALTDTNSLAGIVRAHVQARPLRHTARGRLSPDALRRTSRLSLPDGPTGVLETVSPADHRQTPSPQGPVPHHAARHLRTRRGHARHHRAARNHQRSDHRIHSGVAPSVRGRQRFHRFMACLRAGR